MVVDIHNFKLAWRVARGRVTSPCMSGADMTEQVYTALADIEDQAARGAAEGNHLGRAMALDVTRSSHQAIADGASAVKEACRKRGDSLPEVLLGRSASKADLLQQVEEFNSGRHLLNTLDVS